MSWYPPLDVFPLRRIPFHRMYMPCALRSTFLFYVLLLFSVSVIYSFDCIFFLFSFVLVTCGNKDYYYIYYTEPFKIRIRRSTTKHYITCLYCRPRPWLTNRIVWNHNHESALHRATYDLNRQGQSLTDCTLLILTPHRWECKSEFMTPGDVRVGELKKWKFKWRVGKNNMEASWEIIDHHWSDIKRKHIIPKLWKD